MITPKPGDIDQIILVSEYFYRTRNTVYMIRKYKLYSGKMIGYLKLFYQCIRTIIIEKNRLSVLKAIINGFKQGLAGHIDPYIVFKIVSDKYKL